MKPYHLVPIVPSSEPLVAIPSPEFDLVTPHPYKKIGAPYGEKSPFYVRSGVLEKLRQAQSKLRSIQPGWRIQIFDAYRPVAVQQFMVNHTLQEVLMAKGLGNGATEVERSQALQEVYQFWAVPKLDPLMPPPHSTGAAVDVTLVDGLGQSIDMGSEIDEISARSFPDHFVGTMAGDSLRFDQNRQLLNFVMTSAGFARHYHEWWHFSWGDQLWAWTVMRSMAQPMAHQPEITAKYGRVE
ncbi:MAG: M15 family metallopeptidase [Alkalinema sp. CAN_BIN05]|nr:M15 family metallopeptidase [Alkalinema sp. CAN_BIN05]